jgi:phage baseplate assembly protein W
MITLVTSVAETTRQSGQKVVSLNATATDTDPYISTVGLTVNWGDGLVIAYPREAKPLVRTGIEHLYLPGSYVILVTARNYAPTPQTTVFRQEVVVPYPNTSEITGRSPVIFGPILPRQQGYPNDQQWNFNLSNDGRVIESSLRMLLLTEKGERVMEPDYGTSLRRLIFEPNTTDLNSEVRQEISQAVSQWEPRAVLQSMNVVQDGREAQVSMIFSTTIDQNALALTLTLSNS